MSSHRRPGAWRPVRKPRPEAAHHLEHEVADRLAGAGRDASKASRIAAGLEAAHRRWHVGRSPQPGCRLCAQPPAGMTNYHVTGRPSRIDPLPDPDAIED